MSDSGVPAPKEPFGGKIKATQTQAVAIMVAGGVLFLLAIVVPAEQGTSLYFIKVIVGGLGLVVSGFGAYIRPLKAPKQPPAA